MKLELALRPIGLLTIGYAAPGYLVDVPFYRIGGTLVIPGSTVKGVLRSSAHRIAPWLGMVSCGEVEPREMAAKHAALKPMKGEVCEVCELFGAPGRRSPSRLRVSMFKPVGAVRTVKVPQVSLEDSTLRAARGKLYVREAIAPFTEFKGVITVEPCEAKHARLTLAAIVNARFEPMGRGGLVDFKLLNYEASNSEIDDQCRMLIDTLRRWFYYEVV